MGLIDHMMANLYKPPKQEKPATVLPKHLPQAKSALPSSQTTVTQGQILKGEVLDLRASQILVLLENGITVSARTEGTLNLSIGQTAHFFVAQTTEDQILLKLAKEEAPAENPMIDKALSAANITKTERSVSIVTELLAHQQPVNEANIRHYLSLSAKYPELPVKNLILMELHRIPVTKENVAQFAGYHDRTGKLLTQARDMAATLADTINALPEGTFKQEVLRELAQALPAAQAENMQAQSTSPDVTATNTLSPETVLAENTLTETAPPDATSANASAANETHSPQPPANPSPFSENANSPEQNPPLPAEQPASVQAASKQSASEEPHSELMHSERSGTSEPEPLLKEFLNSFLLEPEDIANPEKVQKYYEDLNEKLTKLEQLSQKLAEHTSEQTSDVPKQMRSNLSFMEAVNQVFPYIQLPLKFREAPAHGELYVYEKKRALKPTDTLSALLHLELEALGTTDIFVTLSGTHVTTRFSMTDKDSGDLVRAELPKLTEALAAKGYTLQSEVTVHEPEDENSPTLLEQFLEEHAPGGLDRYTFDIRA